MQALVAEQVAYDRARAGEYDNDIAGLDKDWDRSIDELPIAGDVLELPCGTGRWTPLLAARARSVTAVDAAPEMLALARQRVGSLPVEFIEADVFGSGWPWRRVGGSASWTTAAGNGRANASCLTRRRRPSGAGCVTAVSTEWSRSTTRRASWPPGWPSWAGQPKSMRQHPAACRDRSPDQ